MQLRKYLFFLSLSLVGGCTEMEPDHSNCADEKASIELANAQRIDSLNSVIAFQKAEIALLEDEIAKKTEMIRKDSIKVNAPKIPEKRPQGDPTDDPID